MWRRRSRSESDSTRHAREAAARAAADRREVEAQWPEVEHISSQIKTAMARNHFGESFQIALLRKGHA